MNDNSITVTIDLPNPPGEVFTQLLDVKKWWGYEDLTGSSAKVNDEFIINHPGQHYSKQRVIELVPEQKVVWWITESGLSWLKNQGEWTNTLLVFELMPNGDGTHLHFTHEGLVPGLECYDRITEGWNMIIKERLVNVLKTGKAIDS
jgi:hypothetical protein